MESRRPLELEAAVVREMEPREYRRFYRYLQQDFHAGEYPPFFVVSKQLKEKALEGLVYASSDGTDLAYALNAVEHPTGMVLISYYAVLAPYRGTGVGSRFLEALARRYADSRGLVVEVEKPEAAEEEAERQQRLRRIRFYERAGYVRVPGISYSIWGIPMHLMIRPVSDAFDRMVADLPERMHDLYLPLLGRMFMDRMRVSRSC